MTVTFIVILSVKAGTGSRMFFIHQKPMEPMEKFHRYFFALEKKTLLTTTTAKSRKIFPHLYVHINRPQR